MKLDAEVIPWKEDHVTRKVARVGQSGKNMAPALLAVVWDL